MTDTIRAEYAIKSGPDEATCAQPTDYYKKYKKIHMILLFHL